MNLDLIFAIIFYGLILLFFFTHRKKFEVQNKFILLYKTKLGLKLMDKVSKIWPKFLKLLGLLGILTGFLGMFFIFFWLSKSLIHLLVTPDAGATLGLVLPGIRIPGSPFFIPFWYGIISILIVATVHEFSHGVFARLYKIKIKSSGFALFGPILAAFVEPEEKQLDKKSKLKQLSIFAAGPFANILTAVFVILILIFVIVPVKDSMVIGENPRVLEIEENSAADLAGLKEGELIKSINNMKIKTNNDLKNSLKDVKPGDEIWIKTNNSEYLTILQSDPKNPDKGNLGVVFIAENTKFKKSITNVVGTRIPFLLFYLEKLLLWVLILSLGIGLVNLLPLGPVDGGKMFYVLILTWLKDEKKSKKIWHYVSFISLFLIVMNLIYPYIRLLITNLF